jgi:hypothetical protein
MGMDNGVYRYFMYVLQQMKGQGHIQTFPRVVTQLDILPQIIPK